MIKQLKIKNFKCISNATLKLAPLTLLTGANSSGKSTTIQALLLLIKHSKNINSCILHELTKWISNFSDIQNKHTNAECVELTAIDDLGSSHSIKLTSNGIEKSTQLPYQYEFDANEQVPKLLYLNTSQMRNRSLYIFEKINHDPLDEHKVPDIISGQLVSWLQFITEHPIGFSIGDTPTYSMGAGISRVINIVLTCLTAKKGDLILLENPEALLHPKVQARLCIFFTFIANSGIQLIIETHSDHILNALRVAVKENAFSNDDCVVHFFNPQSHITQIGINNDGSVDNWPNGFFDEWDIQLDKLL